MRKVQKRKETFHTHVHIKLKSLKIPLDYREIYVVQNNRKYQLSGHELHVESPEVNTFRDNREIVVSEIYRLEGFLYVMRTN